MKLLLQIKERKFIYTKEIKIHYVQIITRHEINYDSGMSYSLQ